MSAEGTFRLPEQTVELKLDGPWRDAVVRVRATAPLATYFRFVEAFDVLSDPEVADIDKFRAVRPILREWADELLVEWNITAADGTPIPATADGLEQLPFRGVFGMVNAWLLMVPEVDLPLQRQSPAGDTSAGSRATRRRRSS